MEKPRKKQLIRGVVDMEYYLNQTWYRGGPTGTYKTETEIEALLTYYEIGRASCRERV